MGSTPVTPLPGMGNDVSGNQVSPQDLLRRIAMQQQPQFATQGSVSAQPAMPQPMPGLHQQQVGPSAAAGEYATKGAHQRASAQALGQTLQNTVAQANNALAQHEQKVLSQKTDAYSHAVQGMAQADEMLKDDPTNAEAAQMKARNQDFLKAFLDPTTPEGKKNIKMLTKAYGVQDGEKTPEQVAAEGSAKKVQAQAKLVAQSQKMQDGSAFPQTAQMSPITQLHAQMVKEGVQPKAATGGQVLAAKTKAAIGLETSQDKQNQLDVKQQMQRERLGLDENGKPKPLEDLPLPQRAKVESERATDELKQASAALAQAKQKAMQDPNSIQNQLTLGRLGAMQKFASASMLRAQVGLMNYHMNATGTGPDGQTPLPGSMQIAGQTVGPKFAAQVGKVIAQQAQFVDIDGGLDLVDNAVKGMQASGDRLNDPRVTKLLTDSHMTASGNTDAFNNWLDSGAGSTLNASQRDYVIAVKQARERIQGLRKLVGQGISNKQVDNLLTTLPSAKTPDADYANRQLQSTRGLVNNLKQGVPKLNLPSQPGQPDRVKPMSPANPAAAADPMGIF